VDIYRKLLLRRAILTHAVEGAAYVPFCGDGDIAAAVYKGRMIYAADLNPKRVEVCRARFPDAIVAHTDCDRWPFNTVETPPFAVADFDAYCHPYASFLAFWREAPKAQRLVLLFTDGHRQGVIRSGVLVRPDGAREECTALDERRRLFNFYWTRVVEPWFRDAITGWRVLRSQKYLRGSMLYWGAVIEQSQDKATED
jgi:hypothetical protein